jgi:predicted nucleic acid-binding Zn ribbon protein
LKLIKRCLKCGKKNKGRERWCSPQCRLDWRAITAEADKK